MTSEIIKTALKNADTDWGSKNTHIHTVGTFGVGPVLNSNIGFYYKFFSEYRDARDSEYCDVYNERVRELVNEHGLPNWAPLSRLPNREETLELIKKFAEVFDSYTGSFKEKKQVKYISSRKGYEPKVFFRDEQRGILVFAGDINPSVGEVDVIDLDGLYWMGSYEYMRKHVGKLPWDS